MNTEKITGSTQIRIPKDLIQKLKAATTVSIQGQKRRSFSPLSDQQVVELALADFLDAKSKIIELNKKLEDKEKIITLTEIKDKVADANTLKKESQKVLNELKNLAVSIGENKLTKQMEKIEPLLATK